MADEVRKIRERDVQGLKYFRQLRPLFDRLHHVGCTRDRAHNRTLHFDQYCCLVMLYMFNPIVSSLDGRKGDILLFAPFPKKVECPLFRLLTKLPTIWRIF